MMNHTRKMTIIFGIILIIECIIAAFCVTRLVHRMRLQTVNAEPNVAHVDELEDYVADVNLEIPEVNGLIDGINCNWKFLKDGADVGDYVIVDDAIDYNHYVMEVQVKNETDHDISGLRLFCSLPTEPEQSGVVCGAATFCSWLQYNESVIASTGLKLSGNGIPIDVGFVYGSAGYVRENDTQAKLLSAYDDANVDEFVFLSDYWRDEGLELNVSAGGECTIWVTFYMSPIYDFEATTLMTAIGTGQTGSNFVEATFRKDYQREFHVRTEIVCNDDIPLPIELWVYFIGKAELLPGTVKMDGELVDDLVLQSGEKDTDANFKSIQLREGAKAGDTIIVEYDVGIWATDRDTHATYIRNDVRADFTSGGASTIVSADIKRIW